MILGKPIIQRLAGEFPVVVDVLRLDLLDPEISGNKWYKLNFNLLQAKREGLSKILTFGGAHSNHIAATAAACQRAGLSSIGVIRGEPGSALNQTLARAKEQGMTLYFVDRELYQHKNDPDFLKTLGARFGEFYLIPEGGNNEQGLLGCREILQPEMDHDYVFCAVGTGTTFAGLVASAQTRQRVVGISVLKGENKLVHEVNERLHMFPGTAAIKVYGNEALQQEVLDQHCLSNHYCFRGYASCDPVWLSFKSKFEEEHQIPLDYVYTSKLMYAVFDLMKSGKLRKGSKVLIVHSGGLQGNPGFEARYHLKPSL